MKIDVIRCNPNDSGNNAEDADDVDNDDDSDDDDVDYNDDEIVEDVRNDRPPCSPINRSRNSSDDEHGIVAGRMVHSNLSMSKSEGTRVLDADRDFSSQEVKVKHKILVFKCQPDKWSEKCAFAKDDGVEGLKGT